MLFRYGNSCGAALEFACLGKWNGRNRLRKAYTGYMSLPACARMAMPRKNILSRFGVSGGSATVVAGAGQWAGRNSGSRRREVHENPPRHFRAPCTEEDGAPLVDSNTLKRIGYPPRLGPAPIIDGTVAVVPGFDIERCGLRVDWPYSIGMNAVTKSFFV